MKNYQLSFLFAFILCSLTIMTSCDRNDSKSITGCMNSDCVNFNADAVIGGDCYGCEKTFEVYGLYSHIQGTIPEFTLTDIPPEISISTVNASPDSPFIDINFDGVRLSDPTSNYLIDSITVVEKNENGEWRLDQEFSVSQNNETNLGVVLALDVSESLGDDFENVKIYANKFVEDIFNITGNSAQVAVVSFAQDVEPLGYQTDIIEVQNFINSRNPGQLTKLYDAMQYGGNMFASNPVFDTKTLVTFTDGKDNASIINDYRIVREQLGDKNIQSNTIGLRGKGEMDESILDSLAINGSFSPANSVEDLEAIFEDYSREITDVYNITYRRSAQFVTKEVKMIIKASPK